jgi:small-conductance mechanosensitive channel
MDWAAGLLIGSILAWFSFKSLKQALDGLVIAFLAQGGREKPRVPLWAYALALLRYGLLALTVYGIFEFLHVPLGSMILGLCALGIATMAASVWEILASEK